MRWRIWLWRIFVAAFVLVLIWLVASYIVAFKLVHRSSSPYTETAVAIEGVTPATLHLVSSDSISIGGWFYSGNNELPVILLLHGNNASRTSCIPQAKILVNAGYPVMMITMRAHGDSSGQENDFGYSARRDVISAVNWIEENHPNRRIVIWGLSLGSAAAIFAAPELSANVSGYILESPYRDLDTAVDHRLNIYVPFILRDIAKTGLKMMAPIVLPNWKDVSPLKAASKFPKQTLVLVLSGENDSRAFPEEGKEIAQQIGEDAEFQSMEGADHLGLVRANRSKYRDWVLDFLQKIQDLDSK